MFKIKKAVIPAAGLGTRLLPATKALPKEMLPIVDKPAIQYIVEEIIASGIHDIMIITGRNKKAIEDHFDKSYELENELKRSGKLETLEVVSEISSLANIHYVRQKETIGFGDAVHCAKSFVGDEPFALLSGDDVILSRVPCLKQLLGVYENYGCSILGVQEVPLDNIHKYGSIKCSRISEMVYEVSDIVEKPKNEDAPSNIAVLGRYILSPKIFECIEQLEYNVGKEIQLTDAIKILLSSERVFAYHFQGKRYDIGDKLGFLSAIIEYALKREDIGQQFRDHLKELIENL